MKRLAKILSVALASFLATLFIFAAPAQAAAPPPGYPTSEIMAQVKNSKYGTIPIRRGFYDSATNKGWGMDKAWHKHNLRSLKAQTVLVKSPNGTKQGNGNIDLKTYAGKYKCDKNKICKLEKQQLVHAIYAPNNADKIQRWPVGGKLGLLTAYCSNDNKALDCANWVTYSLDNPGKNNPYAAREESTPEAPATASPLEAPNNSGELYKSSYSPLPQSIK